MWSKAVIFFLALVFLMALHRYAKWQVNIISGGDTWGYYLYLPAVFVYGDLATLEQSISTRKSYHSGNKRPDAPAELVGEAPMYDNGNRVAKYTLGLAMLYLPFFIAAHLLAHISSWPPDGYSFIYVYTIHLATIGYVLLGLWLLQKILIQWVSDRIAALTLLVVGLGTNLYFFTVYKSPMAHGGLFFLYALLLYATEKWYTGERRKHALLIGLAAGWITLIRPVEIICLVVPILWGIHSRGDLAERVQFTRNHFLSYLLSVGCFIAIGLPQMIYWKWASGKWLFYSYGEEGFDFANPHLVEGLFGFKNGWLTYTPLMVLALLGVYFLFRKRNALLLPILAFLPIHIYITYSWWCWNYISGFGSRPMVETYALLSIPLALFLQKAWSGNVLLKIVTGAVLVFFTWQNISHTEQTHKGLLWAEDSNWAFYKRTIGKNRLDHLDLVTFDTGITPPDVSDMHMVGLLAKVDFEDSLGHDYQSGIPGNRSRVLRLDNQQKFSPAIKLKGKEIDDVRPGDWLRVSVEAMRQYQGNFMHRMSLLVVSIDPEKLWTSTRLDNKTGNRVGNLWSGQPNVWDEVYCWVCIPKNFQPSDQLSCYVWNDRAPDIYLDNLKVEIWRKPSSR